MAKPILGSVLIAILALFLLISCRPSAPEMISVTEVVQLGDEQIIITRIVEREPTPTATAIPTDAIDLPAILDIGYTSSLPNIDPQQATGDAGLDLIENIFAGLTNFNPETRIIEPELAQSWAVGTDGLTWTFNLRDDIQWVRPIGLQPGASESVEVVRPVTAADVVDAVRRICRRSTNTPDAFIFFIIDGCQGVYNLVDPSEDDLASIGVQFVDDYTLTFTLTEPASYFLTMTSLPQMRPVPKELIDEFGDRWRDPRGDLADGWQTPENVIVNGPFIPLASVFSDSELRLIKNPLWPIPVKGNAEEVNITFQLSEDEMFQIWSNKDLDTSILPAEIRDEFLSQTPARAQLVPSQTVFYLGINFDSPVFKEPEVRRAFNAAIDREEVIDSMFSGRAVPMKHFTPPGSFGAPPVDEAGIGYSPDFARLQMDQSIFRSCKLITPVRMLVSTADLSLVQAERIRDLWIQELDCQEDLIIIDQVDFGSLLTNTERDAGAERPDIWELAWPPYFPDAHNNLNDVLHCTEGENRQNRPCSDADRLIRQAGLTPQLEERAALYRQVETLFFGESGIIPVIPLYVRGDYLLRQNWLEFTPVSSGGEQFDKYIVDVELKRLERSRNQ